MIYALLQKYLERLKAFRSQGTKLNEERMVEENDYAAVGYRILALVERYFIPAPQPLRLLTEVALLYL